MPEPRSEGVRPVHLGRQQQPSIRRGGGCPEDRPGREQQRRHAEGGDQLPPSRPAQSATVEQGAGERQRREGDDDQDEGAHRLSVFGTGHGEARGIDGRLDQRFAGRAADQECERAGSDPVRFRRDPEGDRRQRRLDAEAAAGKGAGWLLLGEHLLDGHHSQPDVARGDGLRADETKPQGAGRHEQRGPGGPTLRHRGAAAPAERRLVRAVDRGGQAGPAARGCRGLVEEEPKIAVVGRRAKHRGRPLGQAGGGVDERGAHPLELGAHVALDARVGRQVAVAEASPFGGAAEQRRPGGRIQGLRARWQGRAGGGGRNACGCGQHTSRGRRRKGPVSDAYRRGHADGARREARTSRRVIVTTAARSPRVPPRGPNPAHGASRQGPHRPQTWLAARRRELAGGRGADGGGNHFQAPAGRADRGRRAARDAAARPGSRATSSRATCGKR